MSATETQVSSGKMKAVNYQGPFKVKVEEVDVPHIQHPDDVIVKVTTAGMSMSLCWVLHTLKSHPKVLLADMLDYSDLWL